MVAHLKVQIVVWLDVLQYSNYYLHIYTVVQAQEYPGECPKFHFLRSVPNFNLSGADF